MAREASADHVIKIWPTSRGCTQIKILCRHYFTDGLYPDEQNLRKAAVEAGVADVEAAMSFVGSAKAQQAVKAEAAGYSRSGIGGVPFFIVNGEPAFSGAQPPETFRKLFDTLL